MTKVLIVDNNCHLSAYSQGTMVRASLPWLVDLQVRICRPQDLSDKHLHFDKVILTGSTAYVREESDWMLKERQYLDLWMKKDVPVLGVCFGAQLIARHLFGIEAVVPLPYPINGSVMFRVEKEHVLFKGLPQEFGVVATHYEGFQVPAAYVIGSIDEHACYAFALPDNVFGLQFHPELHGCLGRALVRLQKFAFDRHVHQDFSVKTETSLGKRIFKNFLGCHNSS